MDMVVLTTSEAMSDLLDQRSAIYSDKVRVLGTHISYDPVIDHIFTSHLPRWLNCESLRQTAFYRSNPFSRAAQDGVHSVNFRFHALRTTVAHAPKAVQRLH